MCVIAIKPRNVEIPNDELMELMWKRNSDGAGFMYAHGGNVHIEKGFMTFKEFKIALNAFKERYNTTDCKDFPMVFHFRITTHGGTSRENTHPFPVSDKEEHLKALDVLAPLGMAHNGVIRSVDATTSMSDTMVFIKEIVTPLRRITKTFTEKYNTLLKAAIGYSKLAFLDKDGEITTLGEFEEEDGVLYSNLYHKPHKVEQYSNWLSTKDDTDDYDKSYYTKLEVGKKYVVNNHQLNTVYYSHLKGAILTYVKKIYGGLHKFKVEMGHASIYPDDYSINLYEYQVENYVEKEIIEVEAKEVGTATSKKDNLGGAKNQETMPLGQNGNYENYERSKETIYIKAIPVGHKLCDWERGSKTYKDVLTIRQANRWFMGDDYVIYYKDKHGYYFEIYKADTVMTDEYELFELDGIVETVYATVFRPIALY